MHIVYLVQNTDSLELYVGQTSNLKQRLKQHNSHTQKATKRRNGAEWKLIYAEAYRDKKDATKREAKLKQRGSAKSHLKKRIEESLLK